MGNCHLSTSIHFILSSASTQISPIALKCPFQLVCSYAGPRTEIPASSSLRDGFPLVFLTVTVEPARPALLQDAHLLGLSHLSVLVS